MPSSNEEIIEFDSLTRITQMIFTPSGYSVQIKDENRDIIWEDGVSLEQRGSKIGHKCYTVNFGRSEPCLNCLLLKTKISGLSAVKEDRHLGDGKWYRVLALPILYQGKIMTLEFIKEITQEKQTQQQLKFVTSKDEFYMDVLVHDLLNYLSIANLALEELDQRPNPSSKNIGKFIKIAKQNTNKAINILAELRNLQFDADSELFPVPLVTILNETIAEVQTIYTEKEIYVDYKIGVKIQDATVLANELLSVLLLNILKNSVIHTL
ncbi:MAG: hypothetical protein ACE5J5_06615, partial [Candidatus Hydrothermarchaeales archaeon]